jgi:steroid 5-alpha reductase family enzyme
VATAIALRLLLCWGLAAALMVGLWLHARRVRNASWVDVGWSASFAIAVAGWSVAWPAAVGPAWPLAAMVVAWSLRLATHLARDRVVGHAEEGRYVELRRRWGGGERADRAFFGFFQAQALLVAVLAIAMVVPFVSEPLAGWRGALRWVAVGVFAIGLAGETMADAQLAAWKRDPAHRGQVCEVGLWRYSRHPNYFFEWVIWMAYLIYALAFPWGAIAAVGPAVIFASIWKVTGIPATEAQALRSRGDAYRRYQQTTSVFVPLPRREPRR